MKMDEDMDTEVMDNFPGLKNLYFECLRNYPDQQNPLQINAQHKFWAGGPDPLDYISMYMNHGSEALNVLPHWHYVSFGLSDLHGDGRIHPIRCNLENPRSGFGFEITFRLKKEEGEEVPPLWPANLMQDLAKYIYQTGNLFCNGDHVTRYRPLDDKESRLQHILVAKDSQLQTVQTPCGTTEFLQIVGITTDELLVAQSWDGKGLLQIMRKYPQCGGQFLVTDLRRGKSLLEIDPTIQERISAGIERDGTDLSGACAMCFWSDDAWVFYDTTNMHHLGSKRASLTSDRIDDSKEIKKDELMRKLLALQISKANSDSDHESDNCEMDKPCVTASPASAGTERTKEEIFEAVKLSYSVENAPNYQVANGDLVAGNIPTKYFDYIHFIINLEAALLIPHILKGRIRHGRHFTFRNPTNQVAITFISPNVQGTFADIENKFAAKGIWLHVYMEEPLVDAMLKDFTSAFSTEGASFPKTLLWAEYKFAITIM